MGFSTPRPPLPSRCGCEAYLAGSSALSCAARGWPGPSPYTVSRSSPKESRPGHLPMPSPSSASGLFPSGEAPKEGVAAGGAFSRGPREATLVRFTARAYIVTLGPVLSYPVHYPLDTPYPTAPPRPILHVAERERFAIQGGSRVAGWAGQVANSGHATGRENLVANGGKAFGKKRHTPFPSPS